MYASKVVARKGLQLIRKKLWYRCFPMNFSNFLNTPFLVAHLRHSRVNLHYMVLEVLAQNRRNI